RDKLKQRSAEWAKKYLMDQVSEQDFINTLAAGKQVMLVVPKGEKQHFMESLIAPYVSEYSEVGKSEIYILNKRKAYIEEL
ncbi:MAG: glycosyltransferase family 39 protein, partial [Veillonella caviae]|nr:glycosyltransferase family 39 protein [Veillonella caviae]